MEHSIKDAVGTLPAKSIMFAVSHRHALEIYQSFIRLYPDLQRRGLAKVIDSHMERAEETLDDFKLKDFPRVAISVATHPFVYRDNVNYGICRNLYGLRGLGIGASVLGALVSVGAGFWFIAQEKAQLLPWASAAACVAMFLWWIFTVTASWVKVPAMNYAQHLFAATEKLPKAQKTASSGREKKQEAKTV